MASKKYNPIKNLKHYAHPAKLPTKRQENRRNKTETNEPKEQAWVGYRCYVPAQDETHVNIANSEVLT